MMSFSFSGGVEVYGFISPTDITDQYPVIDPLYGIDGFRNVNTLSDLNSIPNLRRRAGMVVGVSGGTTYYKLNPSPWNGTISDWSLFQTGGGSGAFTGGTVTGDTIFTQGVTATTLNVNGINITGDTYVTGGTYFTGGTIVFDYNTIGNFPVSGLTEDLNNAIAGLAEADELTIELDISTNKIRLKDIVAPGSGGTRTFQGDIVIESGLTANTLNVNGINITGDTYVTGGTYSAGTIDFNYNSGGGFQVLNLYTGETVTISGGTNIQITGSYPSFGVNFTGTTGVDELSELQDVLISGVTGGDTLQYNSTSSVWENSHPFWTIDLMDNSSVEFYAVQNVKINSITNIVGSPTITIADDGTPYTLTNTILSGSKITVTSNIQSVVKLNITY
jgi:hypothetical protein